MSDTPPPPTAAGRSRRAGLVAAGVVGVVLAGALGVALTADDRPDADDPDARPSPTTSASEEATPLPDDDVPADLPTFVDTALLQRCVVAASAELASFPETTDDLVQSTVAQVAELRDLEARERIEATFLDDAAMDERVGEQVLEAYSSEEADRDARLLSALGVVAPDTDVRQLFVDLQQGQVAGFYDPEDDELVVRRTDDAEPSQALSATDKVTLAHEIQHALADQRFELSLDELPGGSDADVAQLAVIEGDATLAMTLWSTRGLSIAEQLGLIDSDVALAAADDLSGVPRLVVGSLLFPYEAGLNLACAAYLDGGWPAVDALYTDPPETSAQVLDLQLWRDDVQPRTPEVPDDPDVPPPDDRTWTVVEEDTLGRLDLQLLFEAPGDDPGRALDDAAALAARWEGGRLVLWRPDGDGGDDPADVVDLLLAGDGLCEPVAAWLDATYEDTAFATAVAADGADDASATTQQPTSLRDVRLRCEDDSLRITWLPQG